MTVAQENQPAFLTYELELSPSQYPGIVGRQLKSWGCSLGSFINRGDWHARSPVMG